VDQLESSVVTKVASDPTPAGDRVFFVAEDDDEKQVSLKWVDRQQEDPVARVIDEFAWSTEDSHVAEFGSVTKAAGKVFGLTYEGLSSDFGTLKLVDEQTGLAGEHVVDTIPRSFSSPGLFQISALNDLVFYIRSGRLKWFDASTEAPFQVNDIGFLHIDATLAKVGDRLYYDSPSGNWGWFDEDFSLGGVSKTVPGIFNVGDGGFFPVGDKLFFSGFDAQYGQELRWIDVTLDTPVVHTIDVNAGAASSDAGEVGGFALAGDKLYFTAIDSAHGSELRWVDVNSDAPTVHTVDIAPGPIGSYAGDNGNLHVAENKLFFTVHDGADDQIVWYCPIPR
jgi:ELWxxDGT repeat protein